MKFLGFIAFYVFTATIALAADSYVIANGATVSIDEHGQCHDVTNNHASGSSIFVPTKFDYEWFTGGDSFLENLPASVTAAPCATSCSGSLVGGYCWYYGGSGKSCNTVCSSHGGCVVEGIRDYAGSGGSNSNCRAVLDALGVSGSSVNSSTSPTGSNLGCHNKNLLSGRTRDTSSSTGCEDAYFAMYRACSCAN